MKKGVRKIAKRLPATYWQKVPLPSLSIKSPLTEQQIMLTLLNMDVDVLLNNLVNSLKPSDPYKIILFGSYASGNPSEHSDIDIMVILDNNHVSKTFEERLDKKITIRNLVLEINRKVPLDILVYSREEFNIVKNYGNYFIDEIEKTGKVIYEKAG